ncbi:hypothetical protein NPD12_3776 (plasmid) [Clostridium botulinum]|uniref:hypothetical protein n=1 Tax=Clostridium botulinum TaxID=1491 RepID=UPI0005188ED6|nr:hypothetical protein [Clostridium botulinum]APC82245.1 hypothetical protein NPD12_3776 [Clostridium botulinum]HBJ1686178.1 hypothetical protein [Clostridium botulinum]
MNMVLDSLKKDLVTKIVTEGYYDRDTGEYIEGKEEVINFKGAILPLSERDLKFLEDGTYSVDDIKLYTNKILKSNTIVHDGDKQYKIYSIIDYGIINEDFKRYYMKRVEKIG